MPGGRAEPDDGTPERRNAADRLDGFWDDLVQTGSAELSATSDADAARASLVAYIHLLTPKPDPAARDRLRRQITADSKEPSMTQSANPFPTMNANGLHRPTPWPYSSTGRSNDRRWWHRPLGAFQVATTVALIIATVGGILLLRPSDDRPSLPAASSPDLAVVKPQNEGSGRNLLNLQLDGPESGQVWVSLSRVRLPSGTRWDFQEGDFAAVAVPIDQFVESGTIAVGMADREYEVPTGSNFGVDGGPTYVRNAGPEPAVVLLLAALPNGESTFAPPATMTAQPIGNVSLPLSIFPDGSQRIVTLSRASYSGAWAPALPVQPQQRTIFVAVESGSMSAWTAPGALVRLGTVGAPSPDVPNDFAPSPTEGVTVQTGETLTVSPTEGITETTILGNEPVETLSLEVTTWTLPPPSPGSADPASLRWDVPRGSEAPQVGLALRRFTLDPGAVRTFELNGVLAIHGIDGTVVVAAAGEGSPRSVRPGEILIGERSGVVEIRNTDTRPATFVEGIVVAGEVSPTSWTGGIGSGWTMESLGIEFAILPSGPATVSLLLETIPYGEGMSSSSYPGNGVRLIGTMSGSFQVVRLAGEVAVQSSAAGSEETRSEEPMLGEPIDVAYGDAVIAKPRSGYSLTAAGEERSTLMSLTVSSETPLDATVPGPRGDEAISIDAAACQTEPRDIQTLYDILDRTGTDATPDAGLRDAAQSAGPAAAATAAAVTATVREVIACLVYGTPLQSYARFSDNAVLTALGANGYTADDIAAMASQTAPNGASDHPAPIFAIDDILIFPDGRAGGIVNANGEIAYLTFVQDPDTGRWLIDAWDDRDTGAAATPEP